jgi:mannose-6-phosphate isomerase-like protein (cupin superfamily)
MTDTIDNPLTGYKMTFLEIGDQSFRFKSVMRQGAPPPVLHVHPYQEERFVVTAGRVAFRMGEQRVVCGPGEGVSVPAGVTHTFENAAEGVSEMLGEYRPGMPEMSRRFHEVYFALARAGMTDKKGMPSIWQIAVEMPLVSDHVRIASPPWFVQRVALALLRPMARALGHRPFAIDPAETAPIPSLA